VAVLEIDRLIKSYGDIKALVDCSFDVHAGEIFGFVGSNGAGKTTAMRITLGVLAADSGEVRWDGKPLDLTTRRRVGYMPEERGLYPKMKIGDQLLYLAVLHGMDADKAARAVEVWTDRLGIGARRKDTVDKLSLGNQQRVQLAAALIHDPDILVLDEPFAGLDPVAVDVMSSVLRERADAGVPVIFSSHQLDLVERICDRVGIIRSGRMEAVGAVDDLRVTEYPQWRLHSGGDVQAVRAWIKGLPGVRLVPTPGARDVLTVELRDAEPGAEQDILAGALKHGPVREFSPVRPSLVDLFRDIVSAEDKAAA
jgi:ABC-2 type transport system ATP-binding protein